MSFKSTTCFHCTLKTASYTINLLNGPKILLPQVLFYFHFLHNYLTFFIFNILSYLIILHFSNNITFCQSNQIMYEKGLKRKNVADTAFGSFVTLETDLSHTLHYKNTVIHAVSSRCSLPQGNLETAHILQAFKIT